MDFIKTSAYYPVTGLVEGFHSLADFAKNEGLTAQIEKLKSFELHDDEILLYLRTEAGDLSSYKNMERSVLNENIRSVYDKIKLCENTSLEDPQRRETKSDYATTYSKPQDSTSDAEETFTSGITYPKGHPMHTLKETESDLFDHLKPMEPVTKRRKQLRRLQRKVEASKSADRISYIQIPPDIRSIDKSLAMNRNTMWDVKELPKDYGKAKPAIKTTKDDKMIGPKNQTLYTIKDSKIVRLKPLQCDGSRFYETVDLKVPVNESEKLILEGTKLTVQDIRTMEKFKDYEPGTPSRVLFVKNLSPSIGEDDLSKLFSGFSSDVRLMSGRMRGQAFVHFEDAAQASDALNIANGTILKGRPVVIQYGRKDKEDKGERSNP